MEKMSNNNNNNNNRIWETKKRRMKTWVFNKIWKRSKVKKPSIEKNLIVRWIRIWKNRKRLGIAALSTWRMLKTSQIMTGKFIIADSKPIFILNVVIFFKFQNLVSWQIFEKINKCKFSATYLLSSDYPITTHIWDLQLVLLGFFDPFIFFVLLKALF